jgi:uroporphyrinogen decarboxylase
MNSRERVLAAVNHKEPDKVPIDLGSTEVTTITRVAYDNLREYLGMEPDPDPGNYNFVLGTLDPREDLLRRYGVDCRPVHIKGPSGFEPRMMPDGTFYDEFGLRYRQASYYYDMIERPLTGCASVQDLDKAPWPDPTDPGRVAGLREEAQDLCENTDYAIVGDIVALGPFEGACILRGHDQFCMDLYLDPTFAQALLDKVTELAIALWDVFLDAVGDCVQVVAQGDDVGMQTNLYISPEMYCRFVKPCQRRIFDFIHSRTEAKVFLHSCGSVYDVIPDFIEIGVDILNPVQPGAAKMDILKLKREFGDDICFWGGGIDVQQVLPTASLTEIEGEVKRAIEILAPGGGYVFCPSHNIQPDVTPDRIQRVYETALKWRDYPVAG